MFNYGQRIQKLRIQKNISGTKLAKDLNIDQTTISKIENNTNKLSLVMLERICDYFSISLSEFFCDETQINNLNFDDIDYESLSIEELVHIYINMYPQNSNSVLNQKKLLEEQSEIENLYNNVSLLLEEHKKNYEIQKSLFKNMLISQMHNNNN